MWMNENRWLVPAPTHQRFSLWLVDSVSREQIRLLLSEKLRAGRLILALLIIDEVSVQFGMVRQQFL